MANWKKIITSGSQAELAGVTSSFQGSGNDLTFSDTAMATADSLVFVDAGGGTKKDTVADVVTLLAGTGLENDSNKFKIEAAQTTITSLYAAAIKIGEDDQTQIDFETADEIHFDVNNSELLNLAGAKISGSSVSTGSFGHIMRNGVDWDDAVSASAAAGGFSSGDITGVDLTGQTGGITIDSETNTTSGNYSANIQLPVALTVPTSIKNNSLVIGRVAADDSINFTNGDISFEIGGSEKLGIDSSGVVVTGNLTVNGTTTTVNTTNTLVTDRFMLLNSGSAAGDGGIIVQTESDASGSAFVYDDSETRWGVQQGTKLAQDASTAGAVDAHVSTVVTSDVAAHRKNGNIQIDGDDEIWIYVE